MNENIIKGKKNERLCNEDEAFSEPTFQRNYILKVSYMQI